MGRKRKYFLILSDTHINGIEYECNSAHSYSLYPIKGEHFPKDIQRVKYLIKKDIPSAKVHIVWKDSTDTHPISQKVPDNAIIKNLETELGKQLSYIQELEATIEDLKKEDPKSNKQLKKEVLKDIAVAQLNKKIRELSTQLEKSRKDNSDLVGRLYQATKNTTPI